MKITQNRLPFGDKVKVKIKLKKIKPLSKIEQLEIIEFLKKYEN